MGALFKRINREEKMYIYLHVFKTDIPAYGLMIATGIISANVLALYLCKKYDLSVNDFIILEAYSFLGAFAGAKLLYLLLSQSMIQWNRIFEIDYLNQLMRGGFVFYGGLIGSLLFIFIGSKVHHINALPYVQKFIFLIPWIHAFGRIGCFLAGCCYGIPYKGFLSVVYPENSLAPSGIKLFPIQLIEAFFLMLIAIILYFGKPSQDKCFTLKLYLILYSILRFITEYFRSDSVRGKFLYFSTSQWISVLLLISIVIYIHMTSDIQKK